MMTCPACFTIASSSYTRHMVVFYLLATVSNAHQSWLKVPIVFHEAHPAIQTLLDYIFPINGSAFVRLKGVWQTYGCTVDTTSIWDSLVHVSIRAHSGHFLLFPFVLNSENLSIGLYHDLALRNTVVSCLLSYNTYLTMSKGPHANWVNLHMQIVVAFLRIGIA